MPDYILVCHSCKESNSPDTKVCRACGFPAVANGAEIEESITGIERQPRLSRKEFLKARRAKIAALPFWKKPFAYVLQAVKLVGTVIVLGGIIDLALFGVALGFVVIAVAELLFQLLKGKPYAWETD